MSDRLTALDTTFLHLERGGAHMHVGAVMVFDGEPPSYDELLDAIGDRLHLVPRYRRRLAHVPLNQGRPVWVDDPHFNLRYHLRHTALARPGTDRELERLAGRLFAQALDRTKPLWELWLVEGLDHGRFALISKTHHALVDGVSGADLVSVLFSVTPAPAPVGAVDSAPWVPAPTPSGAQLLADALLERTVIPREAVRGVRALTRRPRAMARRLTESVTGVTALAAGGLRPAPATPLNVPIGPHRRFTWVDADLGHFKAIKGELGGTVNDVILTAVTLALGAFLRDRGEDTDGLVLRAMIPVSVRADAHQGALGNRVAAMWAPLPVGITDPVTAYGVVRRSMSGLKSSGQAVGAQRLTELADFAPPTIAAQAARLQPAQRAFNLVVTNVPGPQLELFLLGRPLVRLYPLVPLARRQALGIAIMSYHGCLGFGLIGDYDAMADIADLAGHLRAAIAELGEVAAQGPGGDDRAAARASVTSAG